jgi:hypothetical protein
VNTLIQGFDLLQYNVSTKVRFGEGLYSSLYYKQSLVTVICLMGRHIVYVNRAIATNERKHQINLQSLIIDIYVYIISRQKLIKASLICIIST